MGKLEKESEGDPNSMDWTSFTPEIQPGRCMARTWNNGQGGQCQSKPKEGSDLCTAHSKGELSHGRVDGPIPVAKLKRFLACAVKQRGEKEPIHPSGGEEELKAPPSV